MNCDKMNGAGERYERAPTPNHQADWSGRLVANPQSTRPPSVRPLKSLSDVVWPKVQKGAPEECWMWIGAKNHLGYGQINFRNKRIPATRAIWMLVWDEKPASKMHVCHRCDNPSCVNPAHLFLGTAKDNMRDCIAKGRFRFLKTRRGVESSRAKLDDERVADIRRRYSAGENISDLSRSIGMSRAVIRDIVNGRVWRRPDVPFVPKSAPTKKFSETDCAEMERLYRSGVGSPAIAKAFNANTCTVLRIVIARGARSVGDKHNAQRKTHCPSGHEYTPENTKIKSGYRSCRQCSRDYATRQRRLRAQLKG